MIVINGEKMRMKSIMLIDLLVSSKEDGDWKDNEEKDHQSWIFSKIKIREKGDFSRIMWKKSISWDI